MCHEQQEELEYYGGVGVGNDLIVYRNSGEFMLEIFSRRA